MSSLKEYPLLNNFDSIVMFSTADWDNPFWTNKQHMACRLAEAGFKVFYVESLGLRKVTADKGDLLRIGRRLLRFFKGARHVRENVWVYSPVILPLHGSAFVERLNQYLLYSIISFYRWRLGFLKTIGWTYNPLVGDLLKMLRFKAAVYHSVDDLTAAPRLPKEEIEKKERDLLEFCSVVFVTSPTLKEKYRSMIDREIFYYPNVADYEHFQKSRDPELTVPSDISEIPGPRIGFVGAISGYKLDFEMISKAAQMTPSWSWVLIGKVGEGDPTTDASILKRQNIHLLGPRPYQELPAYLKAFDVVIIPSPINDYTRAMFPMKFFEYLAAGKMIVSTELPSLTEFREVFLSAGSPEEMNRQIQKVLSGEVVFDSRMELVAKENTWEKRLEKMFSDLEMTLAAKTVKSGLEKINEEKQLC